jgi:hypothetical protein
LSPTSTFDVAHEITAPGRGDLSSARLEEHLQATLKRLKKLGVGAGACVACALPEGPDARTAAMAAELACANFAPLPAEGSIDEYQELLLKTNPDLLLLHSGAHPAREAGCALGIPIANVLRHFEAGVFTLEAELTPCWNQQWTMHWSGQPAEPAWKNQARGVPVVLVAPGSAYRGLANRLDAVHRVIGITAPDLEHLPLPHTIEHIAAECVRMLRRYRPHGPYALAGWQTDGLVALEMARLLEEEGDRVVLLAMLDASNLFRAPATSWLGRLLRPKYRPFSDVMAEALRRYQLRPWFGKILHLRPSGKSDPPSQIAPHGFVSYEIPAEMLAEPNVQIVATILAAELVRSDNA